MRDRFTAPFSDREIVERREQIIELRENGWPFSRIGAEWGISTGRAVQLHRAAQRDREARRAQAARDAATLDTPVAHLGLDAPMTFALAHLGCVDLRAVVARDTRELAAAVLRYPNVNRRSLNTLMELSRRFAARSP